MQKGFTLIELAIVLVIIGLIIGAVIKSRDLIEQANISSTITDIKKMSTAINTFHQKYNDMPGDTAKGYAFFGAACGTNNTNLINGCNGDNDKCIDVTSSPCVVSVSTNGDVRKIYVHLNLSGIYDITPYITSSSASTDCSDGNLFPKTAVGGSYMVASFNPDKIYMNFFSTSAFTHDGTKCTTATSAGYVASVSSMVLSSIDTKLDDGLGRSGKVQSKKDPRSDTYVGSACDDASGNYVNDDSISCGFRVEIK